jgi:hypothetical protein
LADRDVGESRACRDPTGRVRIGSYGARGTRRREAPEGTMGGREPVQMTSGAADRARLGGTANVPRQRPDGPLPSPTRRWQRGTYIQGPARILREGCGGLRIEGVVEGGGSGRLDPGAYEACRRLSVIAVGTQSVRRAQERVVVLPVQKESCLSLFSSLC